MLENLLKELETIKEDLQTIEQQTKIGFLPVIEIIENKINLAIKLIDAVNIELNKKPNDFGDEIRILIEQIGN